MFLLITGRIPPPVSLDEPVSNRQERVRLILSLSFFFFQTFSTAPAGRRDFPLRKGLDRVAHYIESRLEKELSRLLHRLSCLDGVTALIVIDGAFCVTVGTIKGYTLYCHSLHDSDYSA